MNKRECRPYRMADFILQSRDSERVLRAVFSYLFDLYAMLPKRGPGQFTIGEQSKLQKQEKCLGHNQQNMGL